MYFKMGLQRVKKCCLNQKLSILSLKLIIGGFYKIILWQYDKGKKNIYIFFSLLFGFKFL